MEFNFYTSDIQVFDEGVNLESWNEALEHARYLLQAHPEISYVKYTESELANDIGGNWEWEYR